MAPDSLVLNSLGVVVVATADRVERHGLGLELVCLKPWSDPPPYSDCSVSTLEVETGGAEV